MDSLLDSTSLHDVLLMKFEISSMEEVYSFSKLLEIKGSSVSNEVLKSLKVLSSTNVSGRATSLMQDRIVTEVDDRG